MQPESSGCNEVKYNLNVDTIEAIFKTYPAGKELDTYSLNISVLQAVIKSKKFQWLNLKQKSNWGLVVCGHVASCKCFSCSVFFVQIWSDINICMTMNDVAQNALFYFLGN